MSADETSSPKINYHSFRTLPASAASASVWSLSVPRVVCEGAGVTVTGQNKSGDEVSLPKINFHSFSTLPPPCLFLMRASQDAAVYPGRTPQFTELYGDSGGRKMLILLYFFDSERVGGNTRRNGERQEGEMGGKLGGEERK